ncbi:hypothetical protein MJO29_007303 [Puccinia striiformis f. sp. tritici]|nr:hypothetical protein MJO29_007303 [Puccinia striiformis f. sp. tritici]
MPPVEPSPPDPRSKNPPGTIANSASPNALANASNLRDHAMDVAMNDDNDASSLPTRPKPATAAPLLTYFRDLLAKNASGSGTVQLDATAVQLLLQMMEQQQLLLENFQKLADRVESLELKQMTRQTPPAATSYASATGKRSGPPPPPTKEQMVFARPGQTTIHAKPGTNPLKAVDQNLVVDKANAALGDLNATVRGEKVVIKAVRIQPSGDVTFFSKNRHQKEWLNRNKHLWSKKIHDDLEASPSTYSILAHGVPINFDSEKAQSKIDIAAANDFLSEKIFKIRWLGGTRDFNGPKKAGSIVISLSDPDLADALVRRGSIYLNSLNHRVERFKRLPPQCFKCLQMGHFGKWCKADPKCGRCGKNHETRECLIEKGKGELICAICKDNGKARDIWNAHTPFDKAYNSLTLSSNETFLPSSVLQLNCHNSQVTTLSILNSEPTSALLLLLQEPYIDPQTLLPPDHEGWWVFYSYEHHPKDLRDKHRVVAYVRRTLASTDIELLPDSSKFLLGIAIKTPDAQLIHFLNIYNPPGTTIGLAELRHWLVKHNDRRRALVVGMDSNLHHHSWNPPGYHHQHKDARDLVSLCGKNGLRLISEKGAPTFLSSRGSKTVIDLVWANFLASKVIDRVETVSDKHSSDHQKLIISLNVASPPLTFRIRPPPSETLDKKKLLARITTGVAQLSTPTSLDGIESFEKRLTDTIFHAWQAQGKLIRDNPSKAKKWWDRTVLDPLVRNQNRSRRLMLLEPSPENTERFKYWNMLFCCKVNELKQNHWRRFLSQADSTSIFQALKFTRPRSGNGILPLRTAEGKITSDKKEQAELLFRGTSIVLSECDLSDIPPVESSKFVVYPEITTQETSRILNRLKKKKAAGPDRIPNEVLTLATPAITAALTNLLNSCTRLSYFPGAWRVATTTIIQKFGKPDYTTPGAYRPIALLSTLSKVFKTVIADRLTFWAESNDILPNGHVGGRRGKCGEDAMIALTSWVRQKWREGKVVTALFLDVKSAYPSVHPKRLVALLRQKGCPTYLWKIIAAFLSDRSTNLRLADYLLDPFQIPQGLPQGSPLSVILYILYNTDLLIKDFCFDRDQVSLGFIDDVVHLTAHSSLEGAAAGLALQGSRSLDWGKRHGAIFDSAKAQYMVLSHRKLAKSPFMFDGQQLQPLRVVKWLGIWFDQKLTFVHQRTQVKKKALVTMNQLQILGHSKWGIREQERSLLVAAVLTPRVLYGVQVWYTKSNQKTVRDVLEVINNSATRFALGTLKSTPVKYLRQYCPFKSIPAVAENRIANYFLTKMSRHAGPATRIEDQMRTELTSKATSFPSPAHACLAGEKLRPLVESSLEQISLFLADRPPWRPGIEIDIEIDNLPKAQAKLEVTRFVKEQGAHTLLIFTDGSATPEKGLGAAATTEEGLSHKKARLGNTDHATNFECELVGILLGLEIGQETSTTRRLQKIVILSDSQAAIRRLKSPTAAKPGQYLTLRILSLIKSLSTSIKVLIKWCPGHVGLKGNELADKLAGEACALEVTDPRILRSITSARMEVITPLSKKRSPIRAMFPVQAALHQLRSGHVKLNFFLFKCRMVMSPACATCGAVETIDHYLVSCRRFSKARSLARQELRKARIKTLSAKSLIFDPKAEKALTLFLTQTARLPQLRTEDDSTPDF